MPDAALDPLPLLAALHERAIKHIIVGGFAVNAHGFIRVTKDLDIVPSPAAENLEKLAEMLRDLDATILDTGDFTAEEMPADPTRAEVVQLGGRDVVSELVRMLGADAGDSAARRHARDLRRAA